MYIIKSYDKNLASVKMCKKIILANYIYIGYNVPKLEKNCPRSLPNYIFP